KTEPAGTARSMPSTAATGPKRLVRPSVSMASSGVGDGRFEGTWRHQSGRDAAVAQEQDVHQWGLQKLARSERTGRRLRRLQDVVHLPRKLDARGDDDLVPVVAHDDRLVRLV